LTGLLTGRWFPLSHLDDAALEGIAAAPGSVLGSSRRALSEEDDQQILETFRRRDVRYFFYTGGNGSMDTALRLHRLAAAAGYELTVVGIPKTIDNDLVETDHTPGYGSCARFFAHAVRDIGADTRALPSPITVVETLGRNVGWVVAATALARAYPDDPPHLIYLPEVGVSPDRLCADVEAVYRRLGRCVIAVCEGQTDDKGGWFGAELNTLPGARDALPANMGHVLAKLIWARTGLRARAEKPGLLGRSCQALASAVDRHESFACGAAAFDLAAAGRSGQLITLRRVSAQPYVCETGVAPLESVARIERPFPAQWIDAAGASVTADFVEWARPVAGEVAPHPRLDRLVS
jgi:6-phosphofructokinase 1